MRKIVMMLGVLVTMILTASCATRPSCSGCPEWVKPAAAPRTGEVLDRQRKEDNAVHNRNIRCFCLGETAYCAK